MAEYVTELCVADVLFGRGSGPNDHPGNIQFREYVAARKTAYMATSHRLTKTNLAKEILNTVSANGGRFLRKVEVPLPQYPEGMDVYEVVDDHTIMEKAKQALRQNATRTKEQAASATSPVMQDQEFDLEPIPFTSSGYSGPPPTGSTGVAAAANQQRHQQMHPTPVTSNKRAYEIPQYHCIPQQLRPQVVSGYGGNSPNSSYALAETYPSSIAEVSLDPSCASTSTYSSKESSSARPKIVSSNTSTDEAMGLYNDEQLQDETAVSALGGYLSSPSPSNNYVRANNMCESLTIDDLRGFDPKQMYHRATVATSRGYSDMPDLQQQQQGAVSLAGGYLSSPSPSNNFGRPNSKRESLTIDDLRGFDPKQMYHRSTVMSRDSSEMPDINELSESFSNMKSVTENSGRTAMLMASSDTMGTIDQLGSIADISMMNSSTLSTIFDKPGENCSTMDNGVLARHATYIRSEVVSQPLDNPLDGFAESGATTSSGSRQGSINSVPLSRSSKQSADSTNSSMSFEGLFDSRNKSSGFDSMYSGVRRQVEQEYQSLSVPKILEESSDDPYVAMGQSSIDVLKALEDSDHQQSMAPPPPANDQRHHYYEQDTEN